MRIYPSAWLLVVLIGLWLGLSAAAAVGGLDGLGTPLVSFRDDALRWGALGAWLLVGGALGVGWVRHARPGTDTRVAGRQVALRHTAAELADAITRPLPPPLPITLPTTAGGTQIGPAPTSPEGRPAAPERLPAARLPAVTGETQIGPAPAVTGHTRIGPPPQPISSEDFAAGPPPREVISGAIEVQTQVRRMPEPDTVKTGPPAPP